MTIQDYQSLDRRERATTLLRLLDSLANASSLILTREVPADRPPDSPPVPFTMALSAGVTITAVHEQLEVALVDAALQLEAANRTGRRKDEEDREAARAKVRAVLSPRERRLLGVD